ncbi:MAG: ribose transport system substrate-binding protein [Pseudonocardiales bacterium]|nr:ribose transport system substrate-binding protein [Pseudonocardiales bacterium]
MTGGRASLRVLAAATAVALVGLTGCSQQAPGGPAPAPAGGGGGSAAQKVIGVSVADQKSLFYVAAVQGMQAEADKKGVKLLVTSANNDSNAQVKQVNDLLTQQIGALIFTSQDSTAAAAGVRAANQANVPVIAVDQRPESGQGKLATYIATDSVKAANQLCTWMFQQMGGSGEIAILHGVLGSTAEKQRTEGCQQAIAATPGVKVVAEETANWDETEAFKATQNILSAHPNLKAVFGESDAMGLGAAKAAQQANRHDGMWFVGIDGFPTMFDGVKQGLTSATMAQQPYHMGEIAVDNAISILDGQGAGIPAEQFQDTVLINKDTVGSEDVTKFYGPTAKSSG